MLPWPPDAVAYGLVHDVVVLDAPPVHGDDLRDVVDDDLPLLLRRPVAVLGAARLQPLGVLLLGPVDQYVVPASTRMKDSKVFVGTIWRCFGRERVLSQPFGHKKSFIQLFEP